MRALLMGGYRLFGGRIVHSLAADPVFWPWGDDWDLHKAQAFAATVAQATHLPQPVAMAHDDDRLHGHTRALAPDLEIHTAGPFQRRDYRLRALRWYPAPIMLILPTAVICAAVSTRWTHMRARQDAGESPAPVVHRGCLWRWLK